MLSIPRRRRRLYIVVGAFIFLAVALVTVAPYFVAMPLNGVSPSPGTTRASSASTATTGPEGLEKITKYNPGDQVSSGYVAYDGHTSLEERMVRSDVVARVKLVSVAQVGEEAADWPSEGETSYISALEFRFKVLEYLKGSGGSELVAVAVDLIDSYATKEEAVASAEDFLGARDTRWDDREAIVFLEDDEPHLPSSKQTDRYLLGFVRNNYGQDHYTIASRHSKEWLPAAAATAGGSSGDDTTSGAGDGQQFCLSGPCDEGGLASSLVRALAGSLTPETPTITLAELKTRIAELDAEIEAGDGSQEYSDCVYAKYEKQGQVDYLKQQLADKGDEPWVKDGYFYRRSDHALTSGDAAGTHVYTNFEADSVVTAYGETIPDQYAGRFPLDGRDADLFTVEYPGEVSTARPLPAGEYRHYDAGMPKKYVVCGGLPEEERKRLEHFVTVTAPSGVVHEAFFDPVAIRAAVGADESNGALSPTGFTIGDTVLAMESLTWDDGVVTLNLSPYAVLSGGHLEFIVLDGTVSLILSVDAATQDGTAGTLTWTIATQPWSDGDQLMLRMRDASLATAYPPTGLALSIESGDDNDLQVSFTRSGPPHYYQVEIYRSDSESGTYSLLPGGPVNTSDSPAGFDDQDKGYWYKARGRNCLSGARTGCGEWSDYGNALELPLSAPTGVILSLKPGDEDDLRVSFTRSGPPHHYQVELFQKFTWGHIRRGLPKGSTGEAVDFADQVQGRSYSAQVRSCRTAGYTVCSEWSPWSNPVFLNTPPAFGEASYAFSVGEDAVNGTAVGTVTASDVDKGDAVTYSITGGNESGKFAIDGGTGAITVAGELDHATASSYSLTMEAQDTHGGTDTATVDISVTDVE